MSKQFHACAFGLVLLLPAALSGCGASNEKTDTGKSDPKLVSTEPIPKEKAKPEELFAEGDDEPDVEKAVTSMGGVVYRKVRSKTAPITGVGLAGARVTLKGLRRVGALKTLEFLSLEKTSVPDAALKELAGARATLEDLNLSHTPVTDAGLAELAGMEQLAWLKLKGTHITGAGLKALAGSKKLQKIDLGGTQVTDSTLEELGRWTQLQWLQLDSAKITDMGLKHLTGLTDLRLLDLNDTAVTDEGLKHLVGMKRLENLNVERSKVSAAGAAELRKSLPKLFIAR